MNTNGNTLALNNEFNIANKLFYGILHIKDLNVTVITLSVLLIEKHSPHQAGTIREGRHHIRAMLRSMTGTNQTHKHRVKQCVSTDGRASMHVHSLFYNYAIMHHRCPILPLCSHLNVLCTISYHPHCTVKTDGK